jgi:dolichol-phosphate mannosyltransferase
MSETPDFSYLSIILPTYNESENLKKLIPTIVAKYPGTEILVVDDSSPDGTAGVAKQLGARVIVRRNKQGIGAALKEGYDAAAGDILVSMDADCSIAVDDIDRLLEMLGTHELVIGSKYSKGSRAKGFSSKRQKILSYWGNKFFIILFQLPVDDVTLNFRAMTKGTWQRLDLKEKSNVFLLEMLIQSKARRIRIGQIPIFFSDRFYGKSKTNLKVLFPIYFKFLINRILGP